MKNILFLVLSISWLSYSQDLVNDEYEIYGTLIGEQGYQFYPIHFGLPVNLKLEFKDSIYDEIEKMHMKPINQKKMFDVALRYSINKTFKLIESDQYNQIYLSPIYFKSRDEAYFIYIIKTNLKKTYSYFMQAKKINNKWNLSDYYIVN